MKWLTGKLLVAVPQLADENFRQTVVLMLEHNEHGAVGLILNRPSTLPLRKLWHEMTGRTTETEDVLFIGGPVEAPRLVALHTSQQWGNSQVLPGLFLTHEAAELEKLLASPGAPLRIFAGCAGWGPGQLEGEMEEGSWLIADAHASHALADPDWLWRRVVDGIGKQIVCDPTDLERLPEDPEWN